MRLDLKIINEKGLHARASAKFVETVEAYDADATVTKDGMRVGGDSIMGLMMLAASKGSEITVETNGNQADALGYAIKRLVEDYFGEGK
ncbi:MAG: HPr family phosphocarrier protein [Rhodobacteraceae bacterium]|nr:HPr family phosphocarrier protein [Paracoccaceae bacterium]|tara:strand:- start:728 stop:994 length:267 start_codon:yes stop_codon:yes gene_type:complete